MSLTLTRPLAFFDLETTGLDTAKDRIVEISILKLMPDQSRKSLYYILNPEMNIPKEVSDIHGITNERVANAPKLREVAQEIFDFISDSDLAGFNSNRFDIPMLTEEMLRCGLDICAEKKSNVDVQQIFFAMEKRDLSAAYKFYCNKSLENAHTAEADTEATYEVLMAQLERYPEILPNVDYISKTYSPSTGHVDSGRRILKKDGTYYLCFGKHKDLSFQEIIKKDVGYFNWMYNADFGLHTRAKLKEVCAELGYKLVDR